MALYARTVAATNTEEISRLKRNLIRAVREELTPRQRELIYMHYQQRMPVCEIARQLGVCPSTVTRTLKRAEKRLLRTLRYGAGTYLMGAGEDEP
jgi:RNA polymerase sigma factor (sigma-70 family)